MFRIMIRDSGLQIHDRTKRDTPATPKGQLAKLPLVDTRMFVSNEISTSFEGKSHSHMFTPPNACAMLRFRVFVFSCL